MLIVLALGACASEAGGKETTGSNTGEAALDSAVRGYTTSFLTGDPAAYQQLSTRCQGVIDQTKFETMLATATGLYGDAEITTLTIDGIDGATATVTYELTNHELNQTAEPWILEAGAWRNDDC